MESHSTGPASALGFIVSTLPGWPDVSVLRSAARAGATAVLNLEAVSPADIRSALAALARNKPGRIGVRLDTAEALEPLSDLVDAIDLVIVASGALAETSDLIERLRERPCE